MGPLEGAARAAAPGPSMHENHARGRAFKKNTNSLAHTRPHSLVVAMAPRTTSLVATAVAVAFAPVAAAVNGTRVLLTEAAKADGAVCLDGSPAAVYIIPGAEARKIIVLQRGGAWCTSDGDCAARAATTLGSSVDYPPSLDFDAADDMFGGEPFGMLSGNATLNPMMWNWTRVFLP